MVGGATVAAALSLVVQLVVFPFRSGNLDEGVYVFQARMLRAGMLTLPAAEHGEFFRPWLSGEIDGRIFTEYQFGYPLFLAGSDLLFTTMRAGPVLVAALTPVATWFLAARLLGATRTARWASALVTLTPIVVLFSGMFVTYALTLLLLLVAATALLRAADLGSWPAALAAGAATGAALLVRPLDVLLFMVPVAGLGWWRWSRREGRSGRELGRCAAAAVAGVLPAGVLTLWYNRGTTGAALSFPNMAADELNTFGFGARRLVEGEPPIDYSPGDALRALWENLSAVPSWLPGGALLLGLAVVGALVDRPAPWTGAADRERGRSGPHRAERLTLVVVAVAFPVAYLFWWATRLSASGALNGIGPHYYIPTFAVLCLLAARGVTMWVPPRGPVVAGLVAALALTTAWALPDKVDDKRRHTAHQRRVASVIPDDLADAVVVIDYEGRPYVMSAYPFLVNDPRLAGPVLFAADRGPRNVSLFDRFPDRQLYFLRSELRPGDDLLEAGATLTPMERRSAPWFRLTVRPGALPPDREAVAFVTVDGRTDRVPIREGTAEVSWVLAAPGVSAPDPDRIVVPDGAGDLVIGVELLDPAADASEPRPEWVGVTQSVASRAGLLTVVDPARGYRFVRFPDNELRLPAVVDPFVRVSLSPGASP
jgi:hypothetical protein